MKLDSLGVVIATRRLVLANDAGRRILVKMGKPEPLPDALGDDQYCPFQITGIGTERVKYAAGVDAFQSIELALKMIGAELTRLNQKHGGRLRWECDEHGDLGFPITRSR
jgi:hypothetical protein